MMRAFGGGDHVDGWGLGGGIEVRLTHTPASAAFECMHDWMDKDAFGGNDVTSDRCMGRLRINFDRDVTKVFADR